MSKSRGSNIRQQGLEKQIWAKEEIRNKRKQKNVTSEVTPKFVWVIKLTFKNRASYI